VFLQVGGEQVQGQAPRYVPATNELFFSKVESTDPLRWKPWVIRNLELPPPSGSSDLSKAGSIKQLELVRQFPDKGKVRLDVVFAPDSRHVLTADGDHRVLMWDVETGKPTVICEQGLASRGIAVSPDGSLVAACGRGDPIIHLLNTNTAQIVRTFSGHTDEVPDMAFSPNGRHLLSGSIDKTVRKWDVETGKELLNLEHLHMVNGVAFSPDGNRVVSTARHWLVLWDAATGEKIKETESPGKLTFTGVAYSKDGRHLLTFRRSTESEPTDVLLLWDAETFTLIRRFEGHTKGVRSAVFSPDDRMIVSGGADKTLRVWNVQTGEEIARHEADNHYTNHIAVSPDGRYIVSGGGQYTEGRKPMDDGDHALRLFRMPR